VSLLRGAQLGGGDATAAFNKTRHSAAARLKLHDYDIGAVTDLPKLRLAAKRYTCIFESTAISTLFRTISYAFAPRPPHRHCVMCSYFVTKLAGWYSALMIRCCDQFAS